MAKKFKCPYCDKRKERVDLISHIEDKHSDMLPSGFSATRIVFNSINYGNLDYNGKCVICGGSSSWNEDKARYDRICSNPQCKKKYIENVENNMLRTKGVKRISQTIEGQEKMLANRHISGEYVWSDGTKKTYTGKYELKALEYLDKVMHCKSEDVITPGPTLQYMYEGELHWYISDIYYIPYNLIIEVKDGGDRPNTRSMPEYRAKQTAKEDHIVNNTTYNYLRLTDNDFGQILATMSDLKLRLKDNIDERVININENMFAAMQSMIPTHNPNDVYVVNYRRNNIFNDDSDIAVAYNLKFDKIFYRDREGILREGNEKLLENTEYNVYLVRDKRNVFDESALQFIDEFVDSGFLYECVFENKFYTSDQIMFESSAEPTVDLYSLIKETNTVLKNYINGKDKSLMKGNYVIGHDLCDGKDFGAITYGRIDHNGNIFVESSFIYGMIAEDDNPIQKAIINTIDSNLGGGKYES